MNENEAKVSIKLQVPDGASVANFLSAKNSRTLKKLVSNPHSLKTLPTNFKQSR